MVKYGLKPLSKLIDEVTFLFINETVNSWKK